MRVTIEAEAVAAFARALGADPAAGVPPTFAAVYALAATFPQLLADAEAGLDLSSLLHAEQEFEWTRHPEVGETVVASGRVVVDTERRGVRLVTFETVVTSSGAPLCRSRAVFWTKGGSR